MKLNELKKLNEAYSAYVLDGASVEKLKIKFPPKNERFIGHHVTVNNHHRKGDELPAEAKLKVVGHVEEEGLEALIVSVNGKTKRPDGNTYHITWSLDPSKKKPVDSNDLINRSDYTLTLPMQIEATPELLT